MLAIFILVSLAGCGTARFNPANVSYNVKCSNCFLQNDSLIKFELRTTVDKNNPIELKVRNNSGETIVIDKMMSTLTEEGNVVYQPVFIENPKYNTTSGNSYSSQRNVEIPGLYNPLYDVYYNSSGAEEYSNKYEVNYQPTDKVFVPPYSTATMRIYDIVQQTTKQYLNKRVLYFDHDEVMEIYKN